jgi:hypothetical protein
MMRYAYIIMCFERRKGRVARPLRIESEEAYYHVLSRGNEGNDIFYDDKDRKVFKGVGPKSGKASVEWEATPDIGIEIEIGENADAGMGINWKWHY